MAAPDPALKQGLVGNAHDVSRAGREPGSVYREQLSLRGSRCPLVLPDLSRSFQIFFKWKQEIPQFLNEGDSFNTLKGPRGSGAAWESPPRLSVPSSTNWERVLNYAGERNESS